MKKRFAPGILMGLMLSASLTHAQQLLLTNYTVAGDQPVVGTIVTKSGAAPQKLSLKGPDARRFMIDGQQRLVLRPGKADANVVSYAVEIKGQTPEGKVSESFRIVNDQFLKNKVIAHRGAWKHTGASQNSIGSLQQAIKLGCMGSEFDVHMSADSGLIISHDHAHQGVQIEKTPTAELTALKLANGETMPTLGTYLDAGTTQNKTRLILEIKASQLGKERSLALTNKIVKMVKAHQAQGWVDYISFDYDVCKRIKELDPYAKVAYLTGDKAPELLAADKLFGLDYHFSILKKNENWIDEAQQKKLTINAWTVNDPAMMDWLLGKNVDFITTDEPETLLTKVK